MDVAETAAETVGMEEGEVWEEVIEAMVVDRVAEATAENVWADVAPSRVAVAQSI